jgi:DNA-binding transcriptional ArsR family regulator
MTDDTSTHAPQGPHPETEPLDRLFAVLSNRHRRRILSALAAAPSREDRAFSTDDLVATADAERVRTELVHIHLPLLEAAGYIRWERATDTIRHGPDYEEIAHGIELLVAHAEAFPGTWP